MRTIDGTRYMSAGEYASLKNISKGRVSQIKSTLPFERFDDIGVDLINMDLLELQENEHRLLELQYSTKVAIHQYSYQQLGQFFAKLLGDLTETTEAAKKKVLIIEEQWRVAKSDLAHTKQQNQSLKDQITDLEQQLANLKKADLEKAKTLEMVRSENDQLQKLVEQWQSRHDEGKEEKAKLLEKVMQLQDERAQHLASMADLKGKLAVEGDLRKQMEELQRTVSGLVKKNKDRQ